MKRWTLELTEDELIALAIACTAYQEALIASKHLTIEHLLAIQLLEGVDKKFPEETWFSEEVRA